MWFFPLGVLWLGYCSSGLRPGETYLGYKARRRLEAERDAAEYFARPGVRSRAIKAGLWPPQHDIPGLPFNPSK